MGRPWLVEVSVTVIFRFPSVLGARQSDLVLRLEDEWAYNRFLDNRWLLDRAEGVQHLDGLALWVFPEGGDTPLGRETDALYQRLRTEGVEVHGAVRTRDGMERPRPV
jgi:hypothetical protein